MSIPSFVACRTTEEMPWKSSLTNVSPTMLSQYCLGNWKKSLAMECQSQITMPTWKFARILRPRAMQHLLWEMQYQYFRSSTLSDVHLCSNWPWLAFRVDESWQTRTNAYNRKFNCS
jgi:hypothetical protein